MISIPVAAATGYKTFAATRIFRYSKGQLFMAQHLATPMGRSPILQTFHFTLQTFLLQLKIKR